MQQAAIKALANYHIISRESFSAECAGHAEIDGEKFTGEIHFLFVYPERASYCVRFKYGSLLPHEQQKGFWLAQPEDGAP
ncbi:MAG TPA: hypothetical protein PKI32_06740 [Opitutales bacterium]|nr:hypothetical protein [Opitutales bacterium]